MESQLLQMNDKPQDSYAVEVGDVSKVYRMGKIEIHALRNVTLRVSRGQFVAIVGPSGSGKSTLLHLLGTLDRPSTGRIYIGGVDTSHLGDDELSHLRNERIGFVFQSYNLINRTSVLRNIELPAIVTGRGREERKREALRLLQLVGIGEKANSKPRELSGGEQQRVAIARALMNTPDIVLADEPTGNLDSKTGLEIFNLLRRLCHERNDTVIVVTHNLELAEKTDRVIYLRDGKIERDVKTAS